MQNFELDREMRHETEILELVNSNISKEELHNAIIEYHPNDVAKIFDQLTLEQRRLLYQVLSIEELAPIFEHIDHKEIPDYFSELPIKDSIKILEHMEIDETVNILRLIDDDKLRFMYLNSMNKEISQTVKKLLEFSEDEVGSIMSTAYIEIKDNMLAKDAMRKVLTEAKTGAYINTLYVTNDQDMLVGVLSLRELIIAEKEEKINNIMYEKVISVTVDSSKEDAARIFKDYDFESLPVIDNKERLLGILTVDDIIDVIEEEATEDYAKFAGIIDGEIEYTTDTILGSFKRRSPWLIILLFIGIIASMIIGRFEKTIDAIPILSMFLPMILDMAGNVGTQSLAVTIRYLTDEDFFTRKKIWKHIGRELSIGFLNGLAVSVLAFGIALVLLNIFGTGGNFFSLEIIRTSAVISASMFASLIVSNIAGTVVPLIVHYFKIDPAAASGPFITTINDIIALSTYFTLATIFLL